MTARVLLVFVDGVGMGGEDEERNPFMRAKVPTLLKLTGGYLPARDPGHDPEAPGRLLPLDATLGVDGIPQSGTGQTALLTGENGPRLFGRHFGPWVPVRLRPLVAEQSLLRRATDAGRSVAFANAYPRGWPGERGSRRVAGPPLAARGAGLLTRHEEALEEGGAVATGLTNEGWRRHRGHAHLPEVSLAEAGRNLAGIAGRHELTLFAHYATDTAGHRGGMDGAVQALDRLDAFLGGLVASLDPECTLIMASDHGNIEDVTAQHTRNPALGLVAGPGRDLLAERLHHLTDVTPALLEILGVAEN